MKKYHAVITRTEEAEFDFTDEDIEDDDTPEVAALELIMVDFAGTDPFEEIDETVTITVIEDDEAEGEQE
jgi:hypothetical protein